jgi:Peptidase M50B-like
MGMSINPTTGGCTRVHGGHPPSILCSGYVGSSVLGGLFILGGFDTLVAKLLSFVAGVGLLAPLSLVRDKLYVNRLGVSPMRADTRIEPFFSP